MFLVICLTQWIGNQIVQFMLIVKMMTFYGMGKGGLLQTGKYLLIY